MSPRWQGLWTPRRARLWITAAVAAGWLPVLGAPARDWLDFSAFYSAGRLVFGPGVAQLAPVVRFEHEQGLPIVPFVYPAGLALVYAPFAALPFSIAAALHLALQLGALLLAAWMGAPLVGIPKRWAVFGVLAWGPASAGVISGQNTAIALLLVIMAAVAGSRAAAKAGSPLGALLYKPQLGLLLAGLPLWRREWRVFAVAVLGALGWYAAGIVATGGNPSWPADWLSTLAAYRSYDLAANGWQAVSLPVLMARVDALVGLSASIRWPLTGLSLLEAVGFVAAAILIVSALGTLRSRPWTNALALACCLTLFSSPHAWVYDATLLLPALGIVAADAVRLGWPWQHRWLLAAAYALGATWPIGGIVGFTPVAIPVLLAPLMLRQRGVLPAAAGSPR